MAILLVAGENWVRQSGRSPEWWDSWVIMLWVRLRVFEWGHTYWLTCTYPAGYCEYVHGASWGRVVSQRYAAYVRDALPFSPRSHAIQVYWGWFGGQVVH